MKPTCYKVMEASTRHISKEDADLLTCGSPLIVNQKRYGWWVFCGFDERSDALTACEEAIRHGHSVAFTDLLRYAWATDCRWVELDSDAEDYGEDPEPVVDETTGLKWWPHSFDW